MIERMKIDELIGELRASNTGAPANVLIGDGTGQFWEIALEYSRVGFVPPEPYLHDEDNPISLILRPKASARSFGSVDT